MNSVKGIPLSDIPRGPLCALYLLESVRTIPLGGVEEELEKLCEQGFAFLGDAEILYTYSLTPYGSSCAINTLRAMSQEEYTADVLPLLKEWGDGTGIDCAVCDRQTRYMGLTATYLRMLHCPTCGHTYTIDKEATFTTVPDWYIQEQAEQSGLKIKKRARSLTKKQKEWFAKRGIDEHGNSLLGYGNE